MAIRLCAAAGAFVLLAACGGTPDTGPETVESETAPIAEPAEPTADSQNGEEAMVQPEWDALDRVQDTCGMAAVRDFLGKAAGDIPAPRLPEVFRILAPTDQATMDYLPRRLNILTDEVGTVIGFKCG